MELFWNKDYNKYVYFGGNLESLLFNKLRKKELSNYVGEVITTHQSILSYLKKSLPLVGDDYYENYDTVKYFKNLLYLLKKDKFISNTERRNIVDSYYFSVNRRNDVAHLENSMLQLSEDDFNYDYKKNETIIFDIYSKNISKFINKYKNVLEKNPDKILILNLIESEKSKQEKKKDLKNYFKLAKKSFCISFEDKKNKITTKHNFMFNFIKKIFPNKYFIQKDFFYKNIELIEKIVDPIKPVNIDYQVKSVSYSNPPELIIKTDASEKIILQSFIVTNDEGANNFVSDIKDLKNIVNEKVLLETRLNYIYFKNKLKKILSLVEKNYDLNNLHKKLK
jgi:hypothetical protein